LVRVWLNLASPALRAGIRALLSEDPQIVVLEKSEEDAGETDRADVLISAAGLPISSTSVPGAIAPDVATLLLLQERIDIRPFLHGSAAWGVLPLDASGDELCAAIHALAAGLVVGSGSLLSIDGDIPRAQGPLSEREAEVLGLLAKGLANKQIAAMLGISEHTVKFHVSAIYGKLNAANRTQAVREGLRNGWIVL
jgi:DNA-binding NarL/FixJ family response regulator